jgi:uncharacterized membrane protein (DUF106 family)
MQENYPMLPICIVAIKVFAWIGVATGVISAVIIFLEVSDSETPRWGGAITLLAGLVYFVLFYAYAESLRLQMDMNEKIK